MDRPQGQQSSAPEVQSSQVQESSAPQIYNPESYSDLKHIEKNTRQTRDILETKLSKKEKARRILLLENKSSSTSSTDPEIEEFLKRTDIVNTANEAILKDSTIDESKKVAIIKEVNYPAKPKTDKVAQCFINDLLKHNPEQSGRVRSTSEAALPKKANIPKSGTDPNIRDEDELLSSPPTSPKKMYKRFLGKGKET